MDQRGPEYNEVDRSEPLGDALMTTFTQENCVDGAFGSNPGRRSKTDMTIQFDPFDAYPAAELVPVNTALPQPVLDQIDDVLDGMPFVKTRDRFIGFAVLFT